MDPWNNQVVNQPRTTGYTSKTQNAIPSRACLVQVNGKDFQFGGGRKGGVHGTSNGTGSDERTHAVLVLEGKWCPACGCCPVNFLQLHISLRKEEFIRRRRAKEGRKTQVPTVWQENAERIEIWRESMGTLQPIYSNIIPSMYPSLPRPNRLLGN